jgi:hypothetical protein
VDAAARADFGARTILVLYQERLFPLDLHEPGPSVRLGEAATMMDAKEQVGAPGADLGVPVETRIGVIAGRELEAEGDAGR